MGNVTAIPEGKLDRVSADERAEYEAFRSGSDNRYAPGIDAGEDSYDQYAGSKYDKTPVPHREQPEPALGTDRSDVPETPKVISRNRNKAIDKSEQSVVGSGRKGRGTAQES